MENDILGNFSAFHQAGKAWHCPAVMADFQAGFGQGDFILCLEHREEQPQRDLGIAEPTAWHLMTTGAGQKHSVWPSTAPCRCLKDNQAALLLCLRLHYFCLFLFLSFTSPFKLDLKLGGKQLVFPKDDKSESKR